MTVSEKSLFSQGTSSYCTSTCCGQILALQCDYIWKTNENDIEGPENLFHSQWDRLWVYPHDLYLLVCQSASITQLLCFYGWIWAKLQDLGSWYSMPWISDSCEESWTNWIVSPRKKEDWGGNVITIFKYVRGYYKKMGISYFPCLPRTGQELIWFIFSKGDLGSLKIL